MRRAPQLLGSFSPTSPLDGYYNDLTVVTRTHGTPDAARAALERMTRERAGANPIWIAQLGLGAWQLRDQDERWLAVTRDVADWLTAETASDGLITYGFTLGHTYRLEPPWYSAMAQGEATGLLLRAAATLGDRRYAAAAARTVEPLVDRGSPVLVETADGYVLQEYPTTPPSHVLNGWMFALWGLYDTSAAAGLDAALRRRAQVAFSDGVATLTARLPLYRVGSSWSRYDLYPHPVVNVASPFYHRLHVEQLTAMSRLAPDPVFTEIGAAWARGAASATTTAAAVARKLAFRLLRPRGKTRVTRRAP